MYFFSFILHGGKVEYRFDKGGLVNFEKIAEEGKMEGGRITQLILWQGEKQNSGREREREKQKQVQKKKTTDADHQLEERVAGYFVIRGEKVICPRKI